MYEIQKYAYLYRRRDYQATPTKSQFVFGDPANGFERLSLGRRHGFRAEASWGFFVGGRSGKKIALGLGLADSNGPDDTNFYAHAEIPALGWLQIFGTYMRVNVSEMNKIFDADPLKSPNTVLLSGLRFQLLPFLFINAHYSRSQRVVGSPGSEYHLGNDTIVDANGQPSPFFKQDRLFENVQTVFAELELGWEFDD